MSGGNDFRLGVAKKCINPAVPVRLAGYATRTAPYEMVREDIFTRVHYYTWNTGRLVFVYGDLLWWGSDFVTRMRKSLGAAHGLREEEVFFFASHSHSGPGTSRNFLPALETVDAAYLDVLDAAIVDAVSLARDDAEPVTVSRGDGSCDLNVFRRRLVNGSIEMLPNYDVPADRRLTIVQCRRRDGSLKGAIVSYACHANVANENSLHPDYPGIALRLVDEANPGCVSMFFQGCTADIRPNCVVGRRFFAGSYAHAVTFATDFAADCSAVMAKPGKELLPEPRTVRRRLTLPVRPAMASEEDIRSELDSDDPVMRQWAAAALAKGNRKEEVLDMATIAFAPGLRFFTLSAEVAQDYAAHVRAICPEAVPVSCADGMIGYLPTAGEMREGGYEPDGSTRYFALTGAFREEVDSLVRKTLTELAAL